MIYFFTMSLKINSLILLFIFIHISVSLGRTHRRDPPRPRPIVADPEVLHCLDHCDNTDVYSYLACQKSCELEELYPEEEPWRGRSVSPRWRKPAASPHHEWETPEYEYGQCMQLCHDEEQGLDQCEQLCQERLTAGQRKQDWERERQLEVSVANSIVVNNGVDVKVCRKRCDRVPAGQQRQLCRFGCRKHNHAVTEKVNHHEQFTGDYENPYYFQSRRFRGLFRSEEGHIRVLENFADRSELLRGVENYRLAVLEANPNTFIMPHHSDADYTLFVAQGSNITINLVKQEKKVSHKLEKGDVFRVPAGTTMYLSNAASDQPIQIVKLIHPINTPGSFQAFYPAGSGEPESYYSAFSTRVLEIALNTGIDQLERVFGQQRQGVIIRAREEQLRALSLQTNSNKKKFEKEEEKKEGGSSKTKGEGEENGPFNLLKQKAVYSNKFGRFFEASPDDNKQLKDLDIYVAFAQLNQGAMFLPQYNSKATTLVFVTEGSGWFEMACPHTEEGGEISGRYQQVAAHLSAGDVLVIPPGHPITIIASEKENLHMVGFGINARNNQRNFLAGKKNVVEQIDTQAKELAFNVSSEEIDRVFSNQEGSYFVDARQQKQQPGANGESVNVESIVHAAAAE